MANFLDDNGLYEFWSQVKRYIKINNHSLEDASDGNIVLNALDINAVSLDGSACPSSQIELDNFYNGVGVGVANSTSWLTVSGINSSNHNVRQIAFSYENPTYIKTRTATYNSSTSSYSWSNWNDLSFGPDRMVTISLPSTGWNQYFGQDIYTYSLSGNASLGTLTSKSKIDISFSALDCKKIADDGISSIFVENNTQVTGTNNVTVYSIGNYPSQSLSTVQLFINETI